MKSSFSFHQILEPSLNAERQGLVSFREPQDSNAFGPRCPCSDSGTTYHKQFLFNNNHGLFLLFLKDRADQSRMKIYSDNLKRKFVLNLRKKGE